MPLLTDEYTLSQDATFQHRVQLAIIAAAIAIANEADTVPYHVDRARYGSRVLQNPAGYAVLMAVGVASDSTVATAASSPPAQANVSDAQIATAVSGQWTAYARSF